MLEETVREQSLEEIIENYRKAPGGDFWLVTRNRLRQVVDEIHMDTVRGMRFNRVVDFACGLGVIVRRLSGQSAYVLGMDGAPPAIEKARELSHDTKNVEFKVGSLQELESALNRDRFHLLVITDALSYFSRREQRRIFEWAASGDVSYCLLGLHVVNSSAKGSKKIFADQSDFRTVGEIENFMSETDYEIVKCRVGRVYSSDDISRWEIYGKWQKMATIFAKRMLIDLPTALLLTRVRKRGDEVYDPLALRYRLDWCTWWYGNPVLKRFIEPAISYVSLLYKKRGGRRGCRA